MSPNDVAISPTRMQREIDEVIRRVGQEKPETRTAVRPPVDYLVLELSRAGDSFTIELRVRSRPSADTKKNEQVFCWTLDSHDRLDGSCLEAGHASSFEDALAAAEAAADRLRAPR